MSDDLVAGRVGRFQTSGSVGWTFAAGFVALLGTIAAVVAFVAYGAIGSFPLCADRRGLMLTLVVPAVAAGATLGVSAFERAAARAAVSVAGAVVIGAVVWWIVARVFAAHC